jgi:hypothetical protein
MRDGSPAHIQINSPADRFNLLQGVRTFHLHPHLPHFEMLGDTPLKLDVLVEQLIDVVVAIQTKRIRWSATYMRRHYMDFYEWWTEQPPSVLGQPDSASVIGTAMLVNPQCLASVLALLMID